MKTAENAVAENPVETPFAVDTPKFRQVVIDAVNVVMADDEHTDSEKQKLSRVMIEHEMERMRVQSINEMYQKVLQSGVDLNVYIAYINARQEAKTAEEIDAANRVIAEALAAKAAGQPLKSSTRMIEELQAGPSRRERDVDA